MGKSRIDSSKEIKEQEEAFLNLLRQGKSRKEAYKAIGREKTWASKTIKKIRETEPERLKGTGEEPQEQDAIKAEVTTIEEKKEPTVIKATTVESPKQEPIVYNLVKTAPQEPQSREIRLERTQPKESTPAEEKTEEKANTKPQKQSFSFRADQSKIESWKLYAEAIGTKDIGTLWTVAIDEYISNHELTADQQAIYDLKKKVAEMQKKQK